MSFYFFYSSCPGMSWCSVVKGKWGTLLSECWAQVGDLLVSRFCQWTLLGTSVERYWYSRCTGECSVVVKATTCNIPRQVKVSKLRRQPALRALSTRNLVRSICPEGVLIIPKNNLARRIGAGLSSPRVRSFTLVGFKGTVFAALIASYVA